MLKNRRIDIQLNTNSPALGETIRKCRLNMGLSPREFASQLHSTLTFVLQIERAEVSITSQILEDCAAILGMSAHELVELSMKQKLAVVNDLSSMASSA